MPPVSEMCTRLFATASIGLGRVIRHTFRVQHRGQTGTFRLLFNSILYGPAVAGRPAPERTLENGP